MHEIWLVFVTSQTAVGAQEPARLRAPVAKANGTEKVMELDSAASDPLSQLIRYQFWCSLLGMALVLAKNKA